MFTVQSSFNRNIDNNATQEIKLQLSSANRLCLILVELLICI